MIVEDDYVMIAGGSHDYYIMTIILCIMIIIQLLYHDYIIINFLGFSDGN